MLGFALGEDTEEINFWVILDGLDGLGEPVWELGKAKENGLAIGPWRKVSLSLPR